MCKFRGDPLRDDRDPSSRNLGLKPTNRRIKKKVLGKKKQIAVTLRAAKHEMRKSSQYAQ